MVPARSWYLPAVASDGSAAGFADGSLVLTTSPRRYPPKRTGFAVLDTRLFLRHPQTGDAPRHAIARFALRGAYGFDALAPGAQRQQAPAGEVERPHLVAAAAPAAVEVVDQVHTVPGSLGEVAWSPDGRRLLVAWPGADQWLFLPVGRGKPRAVANISTAFSPGERTASFPRLEGWCCSP